MCPQVWVCFPPWRYENEYQIVKLNSSVVQAQKCRPLLTVMVTTLRCSTVIRQWTYEASHPEEIIVYKQESFKATGVVQDDRLRAQTTFNRLICSKFRQNQMSHFYFQFQGDGKVEIDKVGKCAFVCFCWTWFNQRVVQLYQMSSWRIKDMKPHKAKCDMAKICLQSTCILCCFHLPLPTFVFTAERRDL